MTDLIKSLRNGTANNGQTRSEYGLTEIVGILDLINEGVKIKDLSLLTGRSVHSLRYKFFEKTALKGKEKPRSIQQYESMEALYNDHGAVYSAEDLALRVAEFRNSIAKKIEE